MSSGSSGSDPSATATIDNNDNDNNDDDSNNNNNILNYKYINNQITKSRFTGCGRQAFLWAVGTGCAMALHRWRMASRFTFIKNSFFGTVTCLAGSGYYLCTSERIWKEQNIEETMKVADIKNVSDVDEDEVRRESPFLGLNSSDNDEDVVRGKEIVLFGKENGKSSDSK